ncbi:MAG: InlB B-repeat-containing protein [Candidatus Nealsonbacteria bacterium]
MKKHWKKFVVLAVVIAVVAMLILPGSLSAYDWPNITVTKTADKTSVEVGEEITYTYKVYNGYANSLYGVALVDSELGVVNLGGLTAGGDLNPGATATGTLKFTPMVGDIGDIVNTAELTGTISNVGLRTTSSEVTVEVTVVPVHQHIVKYNTSGGTGTVPVDTNYWVGDSVTVTENVITRDGCIFAGWNSGSNIYFGGETFTMPDGDVTLTAQWDAKGEKGDTGDTGPEGKEGPEGPEGPEGGTGGTGAEGAEGAEGGTGSTGSRGPQGRAGKDVVRMFSQKTVEMKTHGV